MTPNTKHCFYFGTFIVGNDHWNSAFILVMCIQALLSVAIEQTRPDWWDSLRGAKVQPVKQVNWCEEQRGVGRLSRWICGTVRFFHSKTQSLWPNKCLFEFLLVASSPDQSSCHCWTHADFSIPFLTKCKFSVLSCAKATRLMKSVMLHTVWTLSQKQHHILHRWYRWGWQHSPRWYVLHFFMALLQQFHGIAPVLLWTSYWKWIVI